MSETRKSIPYRRTAWLVVAAIILPLLVLFIAENYVMVEVRLIAGAIHLRLAWVVLIALLIGVGIGWLLGRFGHLFRHRPERGDGG